MSQSRLSIMGEKVGIRRRVSGILLLLPVMLKYCLR